VKVPGEFGESRGTLGSPRKLFLGYGKKMVRKDV
jgi:hypothetical protein